MSVSLPTLLNDFLEEKRKQLTNPRNYIGSGTYKFHGMDNSFLTYLHIDETGIVAGHIDDDSSSFRYHIVDGKLHKDGEIKLEFVKIPTDPLFLPIYYKYLRMEAVSEGDEIAGSYIGEWQFREPGLNVDKGKEVFLAMLKDEDTRDFLEKEITNKTQLKLFVASEQSNT